MGSLQAFGFQTVGFYSDSNAAFGNDAVGDFLSRLKIQIQNGNLSAAGSDRMGEVRTENSAAAGNNGNLILQIDFKRHFHADTRSFYLYVHRYTFH